MLSKWGFNDGDVPDDLLDYCDDRGIPSPDGWDEVLHTLVVERLLPALDQRVEIVRVGTSHNPVRALTVDGVDVTDEWYGDKERTSLTPDCVEVPMSEVVEVMLAMSTGRRS
ncbi:hypothetical protein ACQP25_17165 [Microtetraspora malaysiensis]|uniref:hypothetical protein n=1 Tax=Microtetraspora malaysiensis TaxID=161358 RepID=UPI003D934D94